MFSFKLQCSVTRVRNRLRATLTSILRVVSRVMCPRVRVLRSTRLISFVKDKLSKNVSSNKFHIYGNGRCCGHSGFFKKQYKLLQNSFSFRISISRKLGVKIRSECEQLTKNWFSIFTTFLNCSHMERILGRACAHSADFRNGFFRNWNSVQEKSSTILIYFCRRILFTVVVL